MQAQARVALTISAFTGLVLAWVLFDWVGNYAKHCDFDSTCLTDWIPKAYFAAELLWAAMVVSGAVGLVLAVRSGRLRRDVIVLGVLCGAILIVVAATTLHPGVGRTVYMPTLTRDRFFYGSFPWYKTMGACVAACSVALGYLAIRSPLARSKGLNAASL